MSKERPHPVLFAGYLMSFSTAHIGGILMFARQSVALQLTGIFLVMMLWGLVMIRMPNLALLLYLSTNNKD